MEAYIIAMESISPQKTFDVDVLLPNIRTFEESYFVADTPDFKLYLDAKNLRRMSKIVRMGAATAKKCLNTAAIEHPAAIVVATGLGCIEDTLKFLNQIIENKEQLLNPTAFIQSTHNTVSGAIALMLGCRNYNFTFTQQSVSFETSLLDALMLINEDYALNVLLGGIDEITNESYNLLKLGGCTGKAIDNGYAAGEGATFFVLSKVKSNDYIARIADMELNVSSIETEYLREFLGRNSLDLFQVDAVMFGLTGDINHDAYFDVLKTSFKSSIHLQYKTLSGIYDSDTSFATWLAAKIIKTQIIPGEARINDHKRDQCEVILICNYATYYGYSFILVTK